MSKTFDDTQPHNPLDALLAKGGEFQSVLRYLEFIERLGWCDQHECKRADNIEAMVKQAKMLGLTQFTRVKEPKKKPTILVLQIQASAVNKCPCGEAGSRITEVCEEIKEAVEKFTLPKGSDQLGIDGAGLPKLDVSEGTDWNVIAENVVRLLTDDQEPKVFLREACGESMVELVKSKAKSNAGELVLKDVRPVNFASLIGRYATLEKYTADGHRIPATIDQKKAALIMGAAPMCNLPIIRSLHNAPVLYLTDNNDLRIIGPGYDPQTGMYVLGRKTVEPKPDWEAGVEKLLSRMSGWRFVDQSDKSRLIGSYMTSAMVYGNFLNGDRAPIQFFEADMSQTGKGYAAKVIAALYGEKMVTVTQKTGHGLGSFEEKFDAALLTGRPLILCDNMRKSLDSQSLESFATENEYAARGFRRGYITVDPRNYVVYITSNGMSTTADASRRFNVVRFVKQPRTHSFWQDRDGRNLLAHMTYFHRYYLGVIWSILCEWHRRGMPRTDEHRHDFRGWASAVDWIVQNLFGLPPLMQGCDEIRNRMSSVYLTFVRDLCQTIKHSQRLDVDLFTADIAAICGDQRIAIPDLKSNAEDADTKQLGIIFKRLFGGSQDERILDDEPSELEKRLPLEGYEIIRTVKWSPSRNKSHVYRFLFRGSTA